MKKLAPGAVFYDIYKKFHIAFVNIFPVILYLCHTAPASGRQSNTINNRLHPQHPDNMKLITRAICAAAICAVATTTLTLCVGKNTDIEGRWIQPVPGQPDAWQGIALEPDGKASSINMATLAYDTWTIEGNRLILGGKSIGNGQTIDFSDTLVVVRLSADTMVLRMGAMDPEYTREKCQ